MKSLADTEPLFWTISSKLFQSNFTQIMVTGTRIKNCIRNMGPRFLLFCIKTFMINIFLTVNMLVLSFIHVGMFILHVNFKSMFDFCLEKIQAVGSLRKIINCA